MKKLGIILAGLLTLGFSSDSLGAIAVTDQAMIPGWVGYPANPGAENGKTKWTASAGTFTTTTTAANVQRGNSAFSWDASASTQTLTSTAVAIPAGFKGRPGVLYFDALCASGTCTHTFTVDDGTNNFVTVQTIISSTASFQRQAVNFVYPTSGNMRVKITASADEPVLYLDNFVLGVADDYNMTRLSQSYIAGTLLYPGTASCVWSGSGASYTNISAQASCPTATVTGQFDTTAGKIPGGTMNNLSPGTYRVEFQSLFKNNSANDTCVYTISDGTSTSGYALNNLSQTLSGAGLNIISGTFTYTTAQATKTFQVQTARSAGSTSTCDIRASDSFSSASMIVTYIPTQTQLAYSINTLQGAWTGYHDSTCSWARTNTAYGDPTADTTCALTERNNVNFGSVTSALSGSDKLPGIIFTPKVAGTFRVCANVYGSPNVTALAATIGVQLVDNSSAAVSEAVESGLVTSNYQLFANCGNVVVSSPGAAYTVKFQTKASAGQITLGGNSGSAIEWSIQPLTQNVPVPILIGSVSSGSAGMERVERAQIASNGTTINSQSGSWVSSSAHTGTGDFTLTLAAGYFTAAPQCTCNGYQADVYCRLAGTTTATSVELLLKAPSTGTGTDAIVNIVCMGPR